ncbi:MAG: hypothetical protein IT562_20250 [Alphaproteobacteria bacterium]|nr:hypothetical protein [Alphaproteobacteria bacterium]
MALPDPEPGLVLRYDYLWSRESMRGRAQGKERPACLVAASEPAARPRFVVLLPITHTRPDKETTGIEIPEAVRRMLGLDDERCWVIVSEYNVDEWPNGGVSPLPGKPDLFSYGFLPPGLFARIRARFIELARSRSSESVRR